MNEQPNNPIKTSKDDTVLAQDLKKKRLGWKKILLVTVVVIVFLGIGLVTGLLPFAVATVVCGKWPVTASAFAGSFSYELPEDPRYGPSPLDTRYFCSKEAAEKAGYRHVAFPL